MIIRLKNDIGMVKEAKIGFSFTTFFFGAFVPALRGDWKYAGIMVVCSMITCGISTLIFPFVYNKLYIKELLMKGFLPASDTDRNILVEKGFIVSSKDVISDNI